MLKITDKKLEKLYSLTEKVEKSNEEVNVPLLFAKETNKDKVHKITRAGNEIDINEATLWQELYYTGIESEAGEILKGLYPDIFSKLDENHKLGNDLQSFIVNSFGIDPKGIKFSDHVRLIDAMVSFRIKENTLLGKLNRLIGLFLLKVGLIK